MYQDYIHNITKANIIKVYLKSFSIVHNNNETKETINKYKIPLNKINVEKLISY